MVIVRAILMLVVLTGLSSCGRSAQQLGEAGPSGNISPEDEFRLAGGDAGNIWELFNRPDPELTVSVNRYLWTASLDVLSFLPITSIDPFTGVIVTGYGTPPGGGRAYRATVHIKDPALDARSLRVSLQSRGGPVSPATARAVEDAILARARQIRIGDSKF